MKRYALLPVTTVDGIRTPTVPAAATSWVCVVDFPNRNRMLVKVTVPDGTAKTATTIADITMEDVLDDAGNVTGQQRQVEVNDEPLTQAQRDAWKTAFQNAGFNVSAWDGDGVVSRGQLLRFILRRLAQRQDMTVRELLDGWDA